MLPLRRENASSCESWSNRLRHSSGSETDGTPGSTRPDTPIHTHHARSPDRLARHGSEVVLLNPAMEFARSVRQHRTATHGKDTSHKPPTLFRPITPCCD